MSEFQTVCKVGEIPEGEARAYIVDDQFVGIFHVNGEYFAIDDHCPHAGASLAQGTLHGDVVQCRIHHWRFCLRDGAYLDEDKPSFNARTFPIRITDDEIQVRVES